MDNYIEQIVIKIPGVKQRLLFVVSILLTVFGVGILLFNVGIGAIVLAVGCYLIYYAKGFQKLEYEYVFVNSDCDIARIVNQQTRKDVYSFKGGHVHKVLPYTSVQFENELEVNRNLAIKDFTSGNQGNKDNWYMFIVDCDGKTEAIGLELNEKTKAYVDTYYKNKSIC